MMRLKVGTMAQWGPKQLFHFLRTYKKRAAIGGGSKLGQGDNGSTFPPPVLADTLHRIPVSQAMKMDEMKVGQQG